MWLYASLLAVSLCYTLPVWAQDIVRYRGADGRRYFTNRVFEQAPTTRVRTGSASQVKRDQGMALVHPLARKYDIDARLVQAIIAVESNFDARAVSRAGAKGLMQLMPATAARYQVDDPFDPRANVEGGLRYLKVLRHRFGDDLRHVLAAYNAGERAVERYGGIPPYPETRRYVIRILNLYRAYRAGSKIYRYRTSRGGILFTDIPR
jgi:soluble lytic murein transglycosylase-like protein